MDNKNIIIIALIFIALLTIVMIGVITSTSEVGTNVTIDGVQFYIPAGFSETSRDVEPDSVLSSTIVTYSNSKNESISIMVLSPTSANPPYGLNWNTYWSSYFLTQGYGYLYINSYPGYTDINQDFPNFLYIDGSKIIGIAASSGELLAEVYVGR